MDTQTSIWHYLVIIQIFLAFRYVVKASFGNAPEYKFHKLLIVLLVPIAGYFIVMKEPIEVS